MNRKGLNPRDMNPKDINPKGLNPEDMNPRDFNGIMGSGMSSLKRVKVQSEKTPYLLIGLVLAVVTCGILAIGFLLFQNLDDNAAQLKSFKVTKDVAVTPSLELDAMVDQKTNMALYHSRCNALFKEGNQRNDTIRIASKRPYLSITSRYDNI